MLRFLVTFLLAVFSFCVSAQSTDSLIQSSNSLLKQLSVGDSVTLYQCHVEIASVQVSTAAGQTLSGVSHKCSITEKFVIYKRAQGFYLKYFTSSLTDLPNRKFTGLKLREKTYWNFLKQKEISLNQTQLRIIMALENKGHEAIEYDFLISKNNSNQLIVKFKTDFKQLVLNNNYVLSQLLW